LIINAEYEGLDRYTSGRWCWDEEKQLRERYRRFNIPALKRIAAPSVGAEKCISIIKIAEGGFNKIFRLTMDNGASVTARILMSGAGSAFHTIASEVATMDLWVVSARLWHR
jgi:hypothetical protein